MSRHSDILLKRIDPARRGGDNHTRHQLSAVSDMTCPISQTRPSLANPRDHPAPSPGAHRSLGVRARGWGATDQPIGWRFGRHYTRGVPARAGGAALTAVGRGAVPALSLIHISEPTRR